MKDVNEIPVIGISVTEQIGHRNVVLQTHIASDCSNEALNAIMDRLLKAADRQKLYYETKEERFKLKLNLDQHIDRLDDVQKDLVRVEAEYQKRWEETGKRGDYKPSANERQQRANLTQNIDQFKINIGRLEKAIAECDEILKKSDKE